MPGTPLARGIESIMAEVLRAHVLDTVLDRPEVRRGLSPEAIQRIRSDLLERLAKSEESGRPDRGEVEALLDAVLGAAGPAGAAVKALLKSCWERVSSPEGEKR